MKEIFSKLLFAAPFLALILFFALQGKDETNTEIRIRNIESKIEAKRFDQDFSNAWNATAIDARSRASEIVELESELAAEKSKRQRVTEASEQDLPSSTVTLASACFF